MNNALRILVAGAAVALVVVGGYTLLTPIPNVGPPTTMDPSTLPTSPVVETPGPSMTDPSAFPTTPVVETPGPLSPGTSAIDVHGIRATFDIPAAGWQQNLIPNMIWTANSDGRFGFDVIDNLYAMPCDIDRGSREPPVGPGIDALATAFTTMPGIEVPPPTDVTLGGYSGKLVEINFPSASPCGERGAFLWEWTGPGRGEPTPLDRGARTRLWILDIEGTRLVVYAVERDELPIVRRNELQQIVASMRFEVR